jgi:hypothetical protein
MNDVCLEWSVLNLTFIPKSDNDHLNCVRFSFETGIGGNPTGDKVTLKLYLEDDNNREVKVGYVSLDGSGLIDLVPEFRTMIVYIDLINPVVLTLPTSLPLIGEVQKYLLKATSTGQALIGVKLDKADNFLESSFIDLNQGPSQRIEDRFALAVKQDVLRGIIVESFQRYDSNEVRLHRVNGDDVTFSSNSINIHGGLTYSSSCGVFDIDLDLNYYLKVIFANPNGNPSIIIHLGFSFANIGERIQATLCGIIEAIDDIRLPSLLVPVALAVVSPVAYIFAEEMANSVAGDQLNLSTMNLEGLTVEKLSELTWRIDLRPVAALGKWGGLLYPLRFSEVKLDDDGRVVLLGDQDVDPSTPSADEAEFTGEIESALDRWSFKINERNIGSASGAHMRDVTLFKTGNGLASVLDWEILDDSHNCFSARHEPLIYLPETYSTPLVRDLCLGSVILSPQNSFKIMVSFGPSFMKDDASGGSPGQRVNYIPAAGDKFNAKLRVTYKTNDGDQSWHLKHLYVDLEGEITHGYHIEGPSVFTGPNIPHVFVPDEILHIANELDVTDDLWVQVPEASEISLLNVTALEQTVEELIIQETDGTQLARAIGSEDKALSIAVHRGQQLRLKTIPANDITETRFYVQRHQLTPMNEISLPAQVNYFECRGGSLLAVSGNKLYLYDVTDVSKPVLIGKSSLNNNVKILQSTEELDTYLVSDGEQIYLIKPPIKPKRSIVAKRKKIPKREGKIYALKQVDGGISYVSEKQLSQKSRGENNSSKRPSSLGSKIIMVRDEDRLNVYSNELNTETLLEGVPQLNPIEQEGRRLYINRKDGSTAVVDITDPDRPVITAEYSTGQLRRQVKVRGDQAYRLVKDGKHIQTYKVILCQISREKLNHITRNTLKG